MRVKPFTTNLIDNVQWLALLTGGWMKNWCCVDVTKFWVNFCLHQCLLAPDSYEAHLTDVKKALIKSKIETVIVLGGYTKYIQAPDVVWNKPFKGRIEEFFDNWLANRKHKYTDGGNMKAVPRKLVVQWVIKSWQGILTKHWLSLWNCVA